MLSTLLHYLFMYWWIHVSESRIGRYSWVIEFSVKCASKCHFLGWTIQNGIRKESMDYYYHHTNLPSESDPLFENKKCSDLNNPQSLNMNERQQIKENFKSVAQFWRVFVIILTPLVLVPILFARSCLWTALAPTVRIWDPI